MAYDKRFKRFKEFAEATSQLSFADMLQKKIDKQNKRAADNRAAMAATLAAAKKKVDEDTSTRPMGMSVAPKDYKKCPECGGDGKRSGTTGWGQRRPAGVCYTCQGTGYVHKLQEDADVRNELKYIEHKGKPAYQFREFIFQGTTKEHNSMAGSAQYMPADELYDKLKRGVYAPGGRRVRIWKTGLNEDGAGGSGGGVGAGAADSGNPPANCAGLGHIAGIGVPAGSKFGEPGGRNPLGGYTSGKKKKHYKETKQEPIIDTIESALTMKEWDQTPKPIEGGEQVTEIKHASDSPRIPIIMGLQHQLADVQYRLRSEPSALRLRKKEQEILGRIHREYDLIRDELDEESLPKGWTKEPCTTCGERGVEYGETCVTCGGSGYFYVDKQGKHHYSNELNETQYVWVCSKCGKIYGPADEDRDPVKCPRCGSTHATRRDDSELDEELSQDEIEKAAAAVHDEWMKNQKKAGHTEHKSPDGKEDYMVPYDELKDKSKKLDRDAVKATIDALKLDEETFAGAQVFPVNTDKWMKSRFGKNRYHRYSRYVGEDEQGETIRQHGRTKRKDDIILKDQATGAMTWFLRRKKPVK
jgi:hypothetical protein